MKKKLQFRKTEPALVNDDFLLCPKCNYSTLRIVRVEPDRWSQADCWKCGFLLKNPYYNIPEATEKLQSSAIFNIPVANAMAIVDKNVEL